jgi:hypothetical protein
LVSALVWLQFSRFAPQFSSLGPSSSVSAYFGAYAALWILAIVKALGMGRGWRIV